MNLIVCDQDCHHQKEGYCTLNHITSLTGSTQSKCGYYRKKGTKPEPSLPEQSEGLG